MEFKSNRPEESNSLNASSIADAIDRAAKRHDQCHGLSHEELFSRLLATITEAEYLRETIRYQKEVILKKS